MSTREWLFVIFVGTLAAVFEVSIASFLRSPWSGIHPVLFLICISLLRERPNRAIALAIVSGAVLDAFAAGSSYYALLRLVCVTGVLWFIARRFLTNHSLYVGAALVFLARFLDAALLDLVQLAMKGLGRQLFLAPLWPQFAIFGLWDTLFMVVYFLFSGFIARRFVSVSATRVERYG